MRSRFYRIGPFGTKNGNDGTRSQRRGTDCLPTDLLQREQCARQPVCNTARLIDFYRYFANILLWHVVILRVAAGNVDLMAGLSTDLREDKTEGKYFLFSHCHVILTRTRLLGQPRPRRTFRCHSQLIRLECLEESARDIVQLRWLGARVSGADARPHTLKPATSSNANRSTPQICISY